MPRRRVLARSTGWYRHRDSYRLEKPRERVRAGIILGRSEIDATPGHRRADQGRSLFPLPSLREISRRGFSLSLESLTYTAAARIIDFRSVRRTWLSKVVLPRESIATPYTPRCSGVAASLSVPTIGQPPLPNRWRVRPRNRQRQRRRRVSPWPNDVGLNDRTAKSDLAAPLTSPPSHVTGEIPRSFSRGHCRSSALPCPRRAYPWLPLRLPIQRQTCRFTCRPLYSSYERY